MSDRPPLSERLFPELARFETDEQRRKAWEYVWFELTRGGFGFWFAAIGIIGIGVGILPARALVGFLVSNYFPALNSGWAVTVVAIAVVGGSIVLVGFWLGRRRIRRSLRKQLQEARVPICKKCGYDLQGLTESRCPECSTPFCSRTQSD